MRCSRPSWPVWIGIASAIGTMATAGGARSGCTTPTTCCCCSDSREFKAHWFETGTTAFLVETLFEHRVSSMSLDDMVSTGDLLSAFDVGNIGTEALLFQTGYLTITGEEELGGEPL